MGSQGRGESGGEGGVAEGQQGGEKMEHLTSAIKHTEMVPRRMGKCRHLPQWGWTAEEGGLCGGPLRI